MDSGKYAPDIVDSVEKELDKADVVYSDEFTEIFLNDDKVSVKVSPRFKKNENAPRLKVEKVKNNTVFSIKRVHTNGQVTLTCEKSDLVD